MSIPFIVNSQTFIIESTKFSYYLKYTYGFKGYLDYWLTMVVTIDLSYMPERLRYIIHKSIDLKYRPDQNEGIIILQDESNAQKIKSRLEEILKENTIQDFVVTENTEKQNEITLLKKGDIEQLGIYLCTHCGVAFGSEIQRTVHQRIHYFG